MYQDVWLLFIRKSKNPDRFCMSDKAVFRKHFRSPEEAVRWYKRACNSVYFYGPCSYTKKDLPTLNILYRKLNAAVPERSSYNADYLRHSLRASSEILTGLLGDSMNSMLSFFDECDNICNSIHSD